MGTVYAIANQKGGVGKTTTAVNMGACIAEAGYGTLLVDVDPQANATVGLGVPRKGHPGLYEVLTGQTEAAQAITDTRVAGLRLLPAGEGLAGANVELPRIDGFERRLAESPEARFRDLLVGCTERIEVVVRFLAILELHREGKVDLTQAEVFGDIAVRLREGNRRQTEDVGR